MGKVPYRKPALSYTDQLEKLKKRGLIINDEARNVCAHHSRLWNRVMRIQPVKPIKPKNRWLSNINIPNNRTYYVLSMILYLLSSINESNSLVNDFKLLLSKYANIDTTAMGFPLDWGKELLWQ